MTKLHNEIGDASLRQRRGQDPGEQGERNGDLARYLPPVEDVGGLRGVRDEVENARPDSTGAFDQPSEHERRELATPRRRSAQDAAHDQRDEHDRERAVHPDDVRVPNALEETGIAVDQEEVLRTGIGAVRLRPDALLLGVPDEELGEGDREHERVSAGDEDAFEAGPQAARRVGEDGVGEGRGQAELAEQETEGELRGLVAVLQLPLEQKEGDDRHEQADAAFRAAGPGDDAGREEGPRHDDARDRVRYGRMEIVSEDVIAVETEEDAGDDECRPQDARIHLAPPTSSRSDSSDS